MDGKNKYSNLLIIFAICFSVITGEAWRRQFEKIDPFVWDVANYYSYLPSVFHSDTGFKDTRIKCYNYLPKDKNNIPIPKVTYGVSIFYLPWHALAHQIALHSVYKNNGETPPYIECEYWGAVFYSILTLFILKAILRRYFSDLIVAIALAITYFGTNWFYYAHGENLMAHGYLIMLYSLFILLTIKWHNKPNYLISIFIGLVAGAITLIRPIDIIVVAIFVFWLNPNITSFKSRINYFLKNYLKIIVIILSAILIWFPQFIFWKTRTGTFFYDSYGSSEKFFFSDPQILNVLFSYRKGWLLYTPLAALFLLGFFFMKDELKKMKLVLFSIIFITFYLVCTWWDWFFGGCFSHRAFVQHYAYLIFPLCALLKFVYEENNKLIKKFKVRYFITIIIFCGIFLNLLQSFQYANMLIHFHSMTKETYWNVFCKTKLNEKEQGLYWSTLKEPNYDKLRDGSDRNQ